MLEIVLFFLQGIPELTGAVALSLALAEVPLLWRWIIPAGALFTLIIYIIRSLQFTSGLHTVAGLLLMAFVIRKTTHTSPVKSFTVTIASLITLTVLELIIDKFYFWWANIDLQTAISNDLTWKLVGLPQAVLLIIFAVIISKYKKPDKDAWRI